MHNEEQKKHETLLNSAFSPIRSDDGKITPTIIENKDNNINNLNENHKHLKNKSSKNLNMPRKSNTLIEIVEEESGDEEKEYNSSRLSLLNKYLSDNDMTTTVANIYDDNTNNMNSNNNSDNNDNSDKNDIEKKENIINDNNIETVAQKEPSINNSMNRKSSKPRKISMSETSVNSDGMMIMEGSVIYKDSPSRTPIPHTPNVEEEEDEEEEEDMEDDENNDRNENYDNFNEIEDTTLIIASPITSAQGFYYPSTFFFVLCVCFFF